MFTNVQAVVLAAGKSSRLRTGKTKLIEKICGQEMILYPTGLLIHANIPVTLVVGFQREAVEKTVSKQFSEEVQFVHQTEQLGTGHAIACSQSTWNRDHILIMNGDMPLVTKDIIQRLYEKHVQKNAAISFVVAHHCDPTEKSYGRVVKTPDTIKIIEAKELSDLSDYCSLNAGIYIAKRSFLEENITKLQENSFAHEWYITDLIKLASDQGFCVETVTASFDAIRGINTFKELWAAEQVKRSEIIQRWMDHGVRFSMAHTVQIDLNVIIGAGTLVDAGVHLLAGTNIGKNCILEPYSIIKNSSIRDNSTIHAHSVISNATIEAFAEVGPFAHLHEKTTIQEKAVIGNFVEIKKSTIGQETKAKHLAYIGDAKVGKRVNIGAGSITCNYNGAEKSKTVIEDGVFVGSNSTLIAPVTVKKNAYIAAGSTITNDVPEDALAIARERQINKDGYARNLRAPKAAGTTKRVIVEQDKNESSSEDHSFFAAFKADDFDTEHSR